MFSINISLDYRMTSQWNNFTDYVVGNQVQNGSAVVYGCILANRNEPPPNVTYWNVLAPPSGGGLTSLQGLTSADNAGNLTLTSGTATFTTNPFVGTIDMTIQYPVAPVISVNSRGGDILITSDVGSVIGVTNGSNNDILVGFKPATYGQFIQTIPGRDRELIAADCDTTSVVLITYVNAGNVGGPKSIRFIVTEPGSFFVVFNTVMDVGDFFNWFVVSGAIAP